MKWLKAFIITAAFAFWGGVPLPTVAQAFVYFETFGAKGDGTTNDYSAVSKALAAHPTGAVFCLRPGKTYKVESDVIIIGKDLSFTCGGTIHAGTNKRAMYLQSGAERIRVQGIRLKGTQGGKTLRANIMIIENATDVWVDGNEFLDSSSSNIILGSNNNRVRITRNTMRNFFENGVDTVGGSNDDVLIADNFITTAVVHPDTAVSKPIGIAMEPQISGTNSDFVYRNNIISFDGLANADMTNSHGITVNKHSRPPANVLIKRMVIEGNVIRGVGHGMRLLDTRYGTTQAGATIIISGNIIERTRQHGIYVRGGEDNAHSDTLVVIGNIIKGYSEATTNLHDGILLEQFLVSPIVSGNHIGARTTETGATNGRYAVNVNSTDVSSARIDGNYLAGASRGAYNDVSGKAIVK